MLKSNEITVDFKWPSFRLSVQSSDQKNFLSSSALIRTQLLRKKSQSLNQLLSDLGQV